MNVRELREMLEEFEKLDEKNGDITVLMSIDPEGNDFQELCKIDESMGFVYDYPETSVYPLKLTEGMIKQGWGEDDMRDDAKPCIILWP